MKSREHCILLGNMLFHLKIISDFLWPIIRIIVYILTLSFVDFYSSLPNILEIYVLVIDCFFS